MGCAQADQLVVCTLRRPVENSGMGFSPCTHHPRLGFPGRFPYSAARGKHSMSRKALDELKHQIPLLDYLQAHDWQPDRRINGGRLMGLCPLHTDRKPSFLVDPNKNLFYGYGCGRGGDVIRFAEIYHQVKFLEAVALLREWCGLAPLLDQVTTFYRIQLYRHREAISYLSDRGLHSPEIIEHMRIGYAPGRCLRAWLTDLGYPAASLRQAGLVDADGRDAFTHRVVFPLEGNLYGRSIRGSTPHLFLPGSKGGLYLVRMGASPTIAGDPPRGGPVRLRRAVASRASECHVFDGKPSERSTVSTVV